MCTLPFAHPKTADLPLEAIFTAVISVFVKVQGVKSNRDFGKFTVNNTEITAVNIASNGRSAVLGCANGNVHIIQMI